MPGLLRGVARTAVVAGTATAVSGRVQRRQANKFAEQDAQTYAAREQAYQEQYVQQAPPPPPPVQDSGSGDMLAELKTLGELKAQGVLTEEEFAIQKAKILAR
jgi:Short C-terminal domain/Domain of unknwon function (DUF3824)